MSEIERQIMQDFAASIAKMLKPVKYLSFTVTQGPGPDLPYCRKCRTYMRMGAVYRGDGCVTRTDWCQGCGRIVTIRQDVRA